jgi:hypothetical protein
MAANWRLEGEWLKNCSCAYGCPCDFNARPTQGWCKAVVALNVIKGHFNDVKLDGVRFAATVDFPGALHEGNGAMQPVLDERTTPAQREALFSILSGKHSAEGTLFHILSLIVSRIFDPVFAPIRFSFDKQGRKARLEIPGVVESDVEPIKNPVTGADHRIQVSMPEGFEHRVAEVASTDIRSTGALKFEVKGGHSSLATVVHTPQGVAG